MPEQSGAQKREAQTRAPCSVTAALEQPEPHQPQTAWNPQQGTPPPQPPQPPHPHTHHPPPSVTPPSLTAALEQLELGVRCKYTAADSVKALNRIYMSLLERSPGHATGESARRVSSTMSLLERSPGHAAGESARHLPATTSLLERSPGHAAGGSVRHPLLAAMLGTLWLRCRPCSAWMARPAPSCRAALRLLALLSGLASCACVPAVARPAPSRASQPTPPARPPWPAPRRRDGALGSGAGHAPAAALHRGSHLL